MKRGCLTYKRLSNWVCNFALNKCLASAFYYTNCVLYLKDLIGIFFVQIYSLKWEVYIPQSLLPALVPKSFLVCIVLDSNDTKHYFIIVFHFDIKLIYADIL